jgi:diaminopimelate decarboxylase
MKLWSMSYGPKKLLQLAKKHGTPLVVVDHKVLRENYEQFRKHLPRVQVYYAVKANSDPAIVQTFYDAGASFDVASMAEFLNVHEKIENLPPNSGRITSGIASFTRTRSRRLKRWSGWIYTSRWSPTITTKR